MTTDIAVAETRLREARAELARLQAAHDAEVTAARDAVHSEAERHAGGVGINNPSFADRGFAGKPPQQTVEDPLAWIRTKHGRTRSEALAGRGRPAESAPQAADGGGATAADGHAEALRRAARRA
jgi:hypothetical protein